MAALPLSVFIIAKNEADRIAYTLRSVRDFADEVIVIDSGSDDDTVRVAESLGARVVFNAWHGYGPQKKFGESLCCNRWLLNLDADEELSPALTAEIKTLFATGEPPHAGYRLRIMQLFRFQKTLPKFGAGVTQLRLYDKTKAGFKDSAVHDSVVMHEAADTPLLTHPVVHRSFRSYAHAVEKINFYTSMQAEDLFKKGRNPSRVVILLMPLLSFLKCYFIRRYFAYGIDGVIQSFIYAFARTLRVAKARELFQQRDFKE